MKTGEDHMQDAWCIQFHVPRCLKQAIRHLFVSKQLRGYKAHSLEVAVKLLGQCQGSESCDLGVMLPFSSPASSSIDRSTISTL